MFTKVMEFVTKHQKGLTQLGAVAGMFIGAAIVNAIGSSVKATDDTEPARINYDVADEPTSGEQNAQ